MEPIITLARENVGPLAFLGVILVPLFIIYQKKAMPVVFHSVEYCVYVLLGHYVLWLMVSVADWYKEQTAMDAAEAVRSATFTTPANLLTENFIERSLYSPTWLYYFELVMMFVLLYVVVVVRPTTYSASNSYKGDKDRGMLTAEERKKRGGGRYDRGRASSQRDKRT
ncbi:MAG: hypothetical protein VCD00_03475 [Candidatus Hydrogenedentota bacterium]